jgi:SAM-dependent methyltransferase
MVQTDVRPLSQRVPGSFRDPSGYVFSRRDRIGRALSHDAHDTLRALEAAGLLGRLISDGTVVGTRFVEDADDTAALAAEHPGFDHFLDHDRIAPITYPYEWCVSMLADAGLHTLALQERLVKAEFSLKDATAYNIQFVAGRPTFIDLTSIERPSRLDIWYALGQFARMFTFPLLLCRYHGWDLRSYFLASIDGRDVEQVARSLGGLEKWRPRAILDVALPLLFQRRAGARPGNGKEVLEKPNRNPRAQLLNMERLRGKVRKLAAGYKPRGVWADYTATCSYDDRAERAKKEMIRQFLQRARPRRVLDMGCNTGDYSYLAAECGATVVAADADHDAVEILYRRLREKPAAITPMVVDLGNPSPAIGYRNRERANFFDRVDADAVLALAVLHHLLVSGNLTLEAVRDLFYDLTSDYLVLEFVPTDDVMFKRLLKFRTDDAHRHLTLDLCSSVFARRFVVLRQEPIPGSPRTLLFMRKKL